MTIYYYSLKTGVYLGSGEADEDPEVPGEFILPSNATQLAPDQEGVVWDQKAKAWTQPETLTATKK